MSWRTESVLVNYDENEIQPIVYIVTASYRLMCDIIDLRRLKLMAKLSAARLNSQDEKHNLLLNEPWLVDFFSQYDHTIMGTWMTT